MKIFNFEGSLSSSKSIMNRALIIASYSPTLKIIGDSNCDDVQYMRQGIKNMFAGQSIDCGHAGTVLRFLALRASRMLGHHVLYGSERLFSRPQEDLLPIFGQLGVDAVFRGNELHIQSHGWRLAVDGLQVNTQRSSQFASSLVLNSWNIKFPLHFHIPRDMVSEGYFQMTLSLVRQLGMRIDENGSEFFIPANQSVKASEYLAEVDLSSAFAVAAIATVAGHARIQNFPYKSLQPDAVFVKILKDMGVDLSLKDNELKVSKSQNLNGIKVNLVSSPDLFPILGVLCALAQTPSEISGLGHLKYKESSRLVKTKELIEILGAKVVASSDSVQITPAARRIELLNTVVFDVDQDHRMAMATNVAKWAGFPIQSSDMKVVEKSFPEFLLIAGERP